METKKVVLESDKTSLKIMILDHCKKGGLTISNLKEIVEEVIEVLEDNAVYKED
ncbi:hypothetical protein SCH63_002017 [Listeria monocytogenes]|nr:hypothetical protein [Listeria monocytogenes]